MDEIRRGSIVSDIQRRDFLAGTAGFAAAVLTGSKPAEAGDSSFMNNVPDPLLSGNELPMFKFALEKSQGKVIGTSFGKEATVTQLPISKGIAGSPCGSNLGRCGNFTGTQRRPSGLS
jgi:oxalate decarboxylase